MRASGLILGVVVVLGVIGYRIFLLDTGDVIEFNDTLINTITRVDKGFTPFSKCLQQYSGGEEVNLEDISKKRQLLADSLVADQLSLSRSEIPDDEKCKEFFGACKKYIDNSVAIAERYKDVIAYISEHNPGGEEDVDALDELIAELMDNDKTYLEVVIKKQGEMASKFDFKFE